MLHGAGRAEQTLRATVTLGTHHPCMVVEDEAARNTVQDCLQVWQRLEQDVCYGDDRLAQQRTQLTHAVGCSQQAPAHGLELVVSKHLQYSTAHHGTSHHSIALITAQHVAMTFRDWGIHTHHRIQTCTLLLAAQAPPAAQPQLPAQRPLR